VYITRLTISKQPEFESEKPSNMFEREILIADDAVDSLMFGVLSTQEFCCRSRSAQGENLTNGCLHEKALGTADVGIATIACMPR
jgi:hypothetical protein